MLDEVTGFISCEIGIEHVNDQYNGSTSKWDYRSLLQNFGTARSCWAFEEAWPFRLHIANIE